MCGWVIPTGSTFCMQNNKQLIRIETLLALLFVNEKAEILGAVPFQCFFLQWWKAAVCMIAYL